MDLRCRLIAAALALGLLPACATATLIAKATGAENDLPSGRIDDWEATGPRQTVVRFDLDYVRPPERPAPLATRARASDAPRLAVLPPPPPPVVVVAPAPRYHPAPPPQPAPAPSIPEGTVRIRCRQDTRFLQAHYYSERWLYGPDHKLLIGFLALGESAMGTASLLAYRSRLEAGALVLGAFLALDALGTWALLAHPRKHWSTEYDGPSPVSSKDECPDGLTVEVAGIRAPVSRDGKIDPSVGAQLVAAMYVAGAGFSFAVGESSVAIVPKPANRCRWAEQAHLPPPAGCPVSWQIGNPDWTLKLPEEPLTASALP
jgi:hypothetical protein